MSLFRIGYDNLADRATLTTTTAFTDAGPVAYLQNNRRGLIAQASSTASQEIKGHWNGTAYTVSQLALWRHNMLYSETIRLYLYSDVAWTTGVYDSTALAAYESGLFTNFGWAFTNRYFTPQASVKSFKIVTSAVATAFECARLGLFGYTEAAYNPVYGYSLGKRTMAKHIESEGGSLDAESRPTRRTATFDMTMKTDAQRAVWTDIADYVDVTKACVISLFPGVGGKQERDYTHFGCFEQNPAQKLGDGDRFDLSMTLVEI